MLSIMNNKIILYKILEAHKKATIIASAGASTRLAGSKLTNKEVEKLLDIIEKEKNKNSTGL